MSFKVGSCRGVLAGSFRFSGIKNITYKPSLSAEDRVLHWGVSKILQVLWGKQNRGMPILVQWIWKYLKVGSCIGAVSRVLQFLSGKKREHRHAWFKYSRWGLALGC